MSVALRGNLEDFGIGEIFQLIGQQRKTGIVEFSGAAGERVQLQFDRGAVVSAAPVGARPYAALGEMLVRCGRLTREQVDEVHRECEASAQSFPRLAVETGCLSRPELQEVEELLTRETLFAALRWSSGSFDFRAQSVEHDRDVERLLGAEQILMDSLRMVDEWQSFAEFVPPVNGVLRRVGDFEAYRDAHAAEGSARLEAAERVFDLIDGRRTLRHIIDLSMLGTFDASRILADLWRADLVESVTPDDVCGPASPEQQVMRATFAPREWLAAVAPLVLLAVVSLLLARHAAVIESPADAFPLIGSPLESVRQAHETRRVRHTLEAFRFAEGRWPRQLAELVKLGWIEPRALATPPGRAYYYVSGANGPLLLAPEP